MDFFAELNALRDSTPRLSVVRLNNINSDFTANTDQCKNCYLLANAVSNEDCMYGRDFYNNTDCIDCDHIMHCTLCYECVNSRGLWGCSHMQDSANCRDCDFGFDMRDCTNCIGCVGLRNAEFYIFNVRYMKEDFLKKRLELTRDEIALEFEALRLRVPRRSGMFIGTEHCFGDYMFNSKNVFCGFDISECQDSAYIEECKKMNDCYDITVLEQAAFCYEISSSHILNNCNFCFQCVESSDLEFCEFVFNSKNCFGCIGLNHKEYYILNKKYSPEDYARMVAEIRSGLKKDPRGYGAGFFHPTFPFADTVASWARL
ncbi:MAG: hypothetical protein AAB592_01455 [Patescibacteria group bacterium]